MAITVDEPFVCQQMFDTERAAEMELLRRNSDLGSEAKFAAVCETRRGIMVNGGAIYVVQKFLGGHSVRSYYSG